MRQTKRGFILCSFWLVYALALLRCIEEAEKILSHIKVQESFLGLLSEEVEPRSGQQLGNFLQAYGHIGLINSILYLERSKERKYVGPKLPRD